MILSVAEMPQHMQLSSILVQPAGQARMTNVKKTLRADTGAHGKRETNVWKARGKRFWEAQIKRDWKHTNTTMPPHEP